MRLFKVICSNGLGFNRNYDGLVLPLVHADCYGIKGYHALKQPCIDNNGNLAGKACLVVMQESESIKELK